MSLMFLFLLIFQFKSGEGQLEILKDAEDYNGSDLYFEGLKCLVVGSGDKKYQWYHNGTLIDKDYPLKFGSYDTDKLVVYKNYADLRYQGIYQLFVSSSFGRIFGKKVGVKFKVAGKFTDGKKEEIQVRQVTIGRPYRLECPKHSYSSGCLYKWGTISHRSGLRHLDEYGNRVILENGTLLFSTIHERDVADFRRGYKCILECIFPKCQSSITSRAIKFYATATVDTSNFGPIIQTKIKDREVLMGKKFVSLKCAAVGSPVPSYRWVKIDEENYMKDIIETKDIKLGSFNHTLIIFNIKKAHNGTYGCIATINNRTAKVQGRIIVRETTDWLSTGMISNKVLNVFTNLTWECEASGDPTPTYTWYANASKLSTKIGRYEVNGGKITFTRLLVEDTGMYECVAENGFGYSYQTASLRVRAQKPKFNETNRRDVLLANSESVIKCRSNGIPSANHTWTKDGDDIVFSQSMKYAIHEQQDLVIKKVTNEDGGIYKCIATNQFGKDEQTTNVTIEEITFVVEPKSNGIVLKGTTFSLYCKAKSSLEVKYKWRVDGLELIYDINHIWLQSANRLLVQNASESDNGRYECVVYIDDPVNVESTRTADVLVKGPPRALKGFHLEQNCTNFTTILAWQPLAIYNYSETRVIIEWRTTYDRPGVWHQYSDKVNASVGEMKVKNLISWAKIKFRAIAENIYGSGQPSEETKFESCETPPTAPVKCPENFNAVAVEPGVLEIKWNPMTTMDYNGPGFNYIIKYRQSHESTWKQVLLIRTQSEFTISSAGFNTLWYFKIRTNNSEGLGPVCQEKTAYSGQPKPGRISTVIVKDISATSVLITWSSPPLKKGTIDGYKLEYWKTTGAIAKRKRRQLKWNDFKEGPRTLVLLDGRSGEYKLNNLSSLTYYNLSLRGYNRAGDGPPKFSMFQTAAVIGAKLISPMYKRNWFITIISVACFLAFIIIALCLLLKKRSVRYPVGKREREKGGCPDLGDLYDPGQLTDIDSLNLKRSIYTSNESYMADDTTSLAFSMEDKYDDNASFLGEYADVPSPRKYEEMFV